MYAVQSNTVSLKYGARYFSKDVEFSDGQNKHLFFKLPMNSCSPISANTLRQNTVKIITSESFFTDCIKAPTMVFKPVNRGRFSLKY